jgi:acetyltransferase-like isoleucine patch superfamily enzyme
MKKSLFRRAFNRALHALARSCPGGTILRPALHRLRGVKISGSIWIGDDVYLENEYPECVEIHDHVLLSLKCIILAHTKGNGRVIIERDVLIGPLAVVVCQSGKVLRIGEGAIISAGAIIMSSVPAHTIMAPPRATAVGKSMFPYWKTSIEDFLGGLEPIRRSSSSTNAKTTPPGPAPPPQPIPPANLGK